METETIDKLFLELSQVTKATTKKELLWKQMAEESMLAKLALKELQKNVLAYLDNINQCDETSCRRKLRADATIDFVKELHDDRTTHGRS